MLAARTRARARQAAPTSARRRTASSKHARGSGGGGTSQRSAFAAAESVTQSAPRTSASARRRVRARVARASHVTSTARTRLPRSQASTRTRRSKSPLTSPRGTFSRQNAHTSRRNFMGYIKASQNELPVIMEVQRDLSPLLHQCFLLSQLNAKFVYPCDKLTQSAGQFCHKRAQRACAFCHPYAHLCCRLLQIVALSVVAANDHKRLFLPLLAVNRSSLEVVELQRVRVLVVHSLAGLTYIIAIQQMTAYSG